VIIISIRLQASFDKNSIHAVGVAIMMEMKTIPENN
jgi:hypothetical protein